MRIGDMRRWLMLLPLPAAALLLSWQGCAKAPGGGGSGIRLVVTLRYNGPIRDNYHYFFLIRNAGDDVGRNGPIPVIEPPYGGNGFATGKFPSSATAALTDFVHYNRTDQPFVSGSGYSLYHVPGGTQGNPQNNIFDFRGEPAFTSPPGGGNTLQFEIDLGQIQPSTGEFTPNPDLRPRYLQINVISTTTTPANSVTPDPSFVTDAFGDQNQGIGSDSFNTYLTIDTSQIGKTYQSTISPGPEEPTGDSFPSDRDPSIDLVVWSVQVVAR
jgi:hypothetical protein